MRSHVVLAYAQYADARCIEVRPRRGERLALYRAAWSIVLGIEVNHEPFAREIAEIDCLAILIGKGEIRKRLTCFKHYALFLSIVFGTAYYNIHLSDSACPRCYKQSALPQPRLSPRYFGLVKWSDSAIGRIRDNSRILVQYSAGHCLAFFARLSISSIDRSSLCVAIYQMWPYGSVIPPVRSP